MAPGGVTDENFIQNFIGIYNECGVCGQLNFPESLMFVAQDQENQRMAITFVYRDEEGGLEQRLPVENSPIIVQIDDSYKVERIYTNRDGKAYYNVEDYTDRCYDFQFTYCPASLGCGFNECMVGAGVDPDYIEQLDGQLDRIPLADGASPARGQRRPVAVQPAVATTTYCPPPEPLAGLTSPVFCLPLLLLFALLGGALYLSGRNPFGGFDFSAPRLHKPFQYAARGRGMTISMAGIANLVGSTAGATRAAIKGIRAKDEQGKPITGIAGRMEAMDQAAGGGRVSMIVGAGGTPLQMISGAGRRGGPQRGGTGPETASKSPLSILTRALPFLSPAVSAEPGTSTGHRMGLGFISLLSQSSFGIFIHSTGQVSGKQDWMGAIAEWMALPSVEKAERAHNEASGVREKETKKGTYRTVYDAKSGDSVIYRMDANGKAARDAQGKPIVFRMARDAKTGEVALYRAEADGNIRRDAAGSVVVADAKELPKGVYSLASGMHMDYEVKTSQGIFAVVYDEKAKTAEGKTGTFVVYKDGKQVGIHEAPEEVHRRVNFRVGQMAEGTFTIGKDAMAAATKQQEAVEKEMEGLELDAKEIGAKAEDYRKAEVYEGLGYGKKGGADVETADKVYAAVVKAEAKGERLAPVIAKALGATGKNAKPEDVQRAEKVAIQLEATRGQAGQAALATALENAPPEKVAALARDMERLGLLQQTAGMAQRYMPQVVKAQDKMGEGGLDVHGLEVANQSVEIMGEVAAARVAAEGLRQPDPKKAKEDAAVLRGYVAANLALQQTEAKKGREPEYWVAPIAGTNNGMSFASFLDRNGLATKGAFAQGLQTASLGSENAAFNATEITLRTQLYHEGIPQDNTHVDRMVAPVVEGERTLGMMQAVRQQMEGVQQLLNMAHAEVVVEQHGDMPVRSAGKVSTPSDISPVHFTTTQVTDTPSVQHTAAVRELARERLRVTPEEYYANREQYAWMDRAAVTAASMGSTTKMPKGREGEPMKAILYAQKQFEAYRATETPEERRAIVQETLREMDDAQVRTRIVKKKEREFELGHAENPLGPTPEKSLEAQYLRQQAQREQSREMEEMRNAQQLLRRQQAMEREQAAEARRRLEEEARKQREKQLRPEDDQLKRGRKVEEPAEEAARREKEELEALTRAKELAKKRKKKEE